DLVWNLVKNYLLTFGFLTSIYLLFTAFELWKFAGTMDGGVLLLIKYLLFLIPFVYIEIAPSALMIATLATYIIKSRQNEIVTWTAAGRSVYRLLMPCFVFMIFIGAVNFVMQETILTETNRKQDALRQEIRSGNKTKKERPRIWLTAADNIISYKNASDNETNVVKDILILTFAPTNFDLISLTKVDSGRFDKTSLKFNSAPRKFTFREGTIV
ncbi:MAG: LptF/LptG family permease, partial [Acidobacteria bacterium]|nr:LptF/LptG family permease [Acidobacteriota bacterium]